MEDINLEEQKETKTETEKQPDEGDFRLDLSV